MGHVHQPLSHSVLWDLYAARQQLLAEDFNPRGPGTPRILSAPSVSPHPVPFSPVQPPAFCSKSAKALTLSLPSNCFNPQSCSSPGNQRILQLLSTGLRLMVCLMRLFLPYLGKLGSMVNGSISQGRRRKLSPLTLIYFTHCIKLSNVLGKNRPIIW